MARTIWKFTLELTDEQTLMVPPGTNFISAQEQNGELCLWATVDPDRGCTAERRIFIVGTGNPMPSETLQFIGTVQQVLGGKFVWHIFEG